MALLYLGLGSNLGERKQILHQAINLITKRIGSCLRLSAFYETAPWGFVSEHPFLNAAALFQTRLAPEKVLIITQEIERELGRTHKSTKLGYADRTIDIDLLLYDDNIINKDITPDHGYTTNHLTLPHPLMHKRLFVLEPLAEIAPDTIHPTLHRTFRELLEICRKDSNTD